MKVRFYPKKEAVLSVVNEVVAKRSGHLDEAKERLRKLNESSLYVDPSVSLAREQLVVAAEMSLQEAEQQRDLLESHAPAEVMAEFELDVG